MKFSVLIPVYNTEKYLEECLQSVLSQTYQDFEIIIVDDGSTDSSGAICDKFQCDFPETIKVIHKENQGQLAARCNAIQAAKGDYCIFVDSDDLLISSALDIIYDNLKEYCFPDILIYSFFYEEPNGKQRKAKKLFDEGIIDLDYVHEMFYTGVGLNNVWTKAVKRSIAECGGFDFTKFYSLSCAEDALHSMVMVDQCKTVVYIYQQLYRYRLFDYSTTRQYTIDRIDCFNDICLYETRLFFANKWGLFINQWQQRIDANVIIHLLYVFDLFYMNCSRKSRKSVIDYPWINFVPEKLQSKQIYNNELLSKTQKSLLAWIIEKDRFKIKLYYLKKRTYKKVRNAKRKIINHE